MSDQNRTLTILLKLKADTAAATSQFNSSLKQIQAQAAQASATVSSVQGGGNSTQVAAIQASQAAVTASKEQQLIVEQQLQRIAAVRFDLVAAEVAGDKARQAVLREELLIRNATTQALRVNAFTQVELNQALAAQNILLATSAAKAEAMVAPTLLGEFNLKRSASSAAALAQALNTGNITASSFRTVVGSFSTSLTLAALAGFEIYHGIQAAVQEGQQFSKEVAAFVKGIGDAVTETTRLARESESIGDTIKISDKWSVELAQVEAKLAEFRARQIGFWASFTDQFVKMFGEAWNSLVDTIHGLGFGVDTRGPFKREADADVETANAAAKKALEDSNTAYKTSMQARSAWAQAIADPKAGMAFYENKINEINGKIAGVDTSTLEGQKQLNAFLHDLDDAMSKHDQLGNAMDKNNRRAKEHAGTQKEINELVREQANLLAGIRGQQQIVSQNPFLTDDQKNAQMIPLITAEIGQLNAQIARDKVVLKNSALDPAQYQEVAGKIQQAGLQVTLLGRKLRSLSFGGQLRAELTSWASQFSSAAHAVAEIITGTLNIAINATSQAITNLIFKTGSWKQAFYQAAQSIVQNIIQILLQWIISQTIMLALSKVFGKANAQAATTGATNAASAWSAAAVSASIATEGAAAATGTGAYLIALVAGQAAALAASSAGSFDTGGFTRGREGQPAGIVHGQEYVFSAPATRRIGLSVLDTLHTNAVRQNYSTGGFVGNSMPRASEGGRRVEVHIFNFTDKKKLTDAVMNSRAGQKIIVNTMDGRGPKRVL